MTDDDRANMTCTLCREAISARVDGEAMDIDARIVDAHLRHCTECRRFEQVAERTRRPGAIGVAAPMPDLSRRVTKLAAIADRASAWSTVRVVLAVVALEILVFSVPDLVARDESGGAAHDARHLGAFTIAYAVALLVVVVRPARARTVLPVAAVLAGALLITAMVDLVNGNVPLSGEAQHLPELLSVGLIWALATPSRRRRRPQRQDRPHRLELVERADREAS